MALRVIVMSVANIVFLPIFMPGYYRTPMAVAAVIHFIAAFNAVQGAMSSAGGFFLYEAVTSRIPSLKN